MNKHKAAKKWRPLSSKRSTAIVGLVAVALLAANVVPFRYSQTRSCPGLGSYTQDGRSMGVPFSYFRTVNGGITDCSGFFGDTASRMFSAQALIGDALLAGLAMIGVNVLVDSRRVKV